MGPAQHDILHSLGPLGPLGRDHACCYDQWRFGDEPRTARGSAPFGSAVAQGFHCQSGRCIVALSTTLRARGAASTDGRELYQYDQEGESFFGNRDLNILARNITVPGLSPLFPDVHCTADASVCQLIAGEGEINAASSAAALVWSPQFDLRKTYFLIAGVAAVDPLVTTIGSVTFARFAVQVDLEYAFDQRDIPNNFTTGWIPQGSVVPGQYPTEIYGTEVFELNQRLRDTAIEIVKKSNVKLNDTRGAAQYRALYNGDRAFAAAAKPPSVVACDSITSNNYYSGTRLNEAFRNYTRLITNGTALYCTSQQEDNAILEVLMRGNKAKKTDLSRVIILRTVSDFIPPPPTISSTNNLFYGQDGYVPALENLHIAGIPVIQTIVKEWDHTFSKGIAPTNYVGDILGSLGGKPDFGPGPVQEPEPLTPLNLGRRAVADSQARGPRPSAPKIRTRRKRLPSMPLVP